MADAIWFALSAAQRRFLAAFPTLAGGECRAELVLDASTPRDRIEMALRDACARHEALRSRLVPHGDGDAPAIAVSDEPALDWTIDAVAQGWRVALAAPALCIDRASWAILAGEIADACVLVDTRGRSPGFAGIVRDLAE